MTEQETIEGLKCVVADISEQCERLKAENAALRERLEKAVELPFLYLETLKLLTCAACSYGEIKLLLESKMRDNKAFAEVYMQIPIVQGGVNDWALKDLATANIDCNKIKSFEDILSTMPNYKKHLEAAEKRLAELGGEK